VEPRFVRSQLAISTVLVAVILIVLLIGAIAIGLFLTLKTSSSNQKSSVVQTILLSSAGRSGHLQMTLDFPGTLVASPDLAWVNYTVSFQSMGNLPQNLSLIVQAPSGLVARFEKSMLTLGANRSANTLQLESSSTTSQGNYQLTMLAIGGGANYSAALTVQVEKYLVVTIGTSFIPQNLTVDQSGTVTWLRLNGILSPSDDGSHDVDFSSGISTVSPTLAQYQSWSYQFNETGNYSYYCKYHPFMTGNINVISSS
jgi:plastocyanin